MPVWFQSLRFYTWQLSDKIPCLWSHQDSGHWRHQPLILECYPDACLPSRKTFLSVMRNRFSPVCTLLKTQFGSRLHFHVWISFRHSHPKKMLVLGNQSPYLSLWRSDEESGMWVSRAIAELLLGSLWDANSCCPKWIWNGRRLSAPIIPWPQSNSPTGFLLFGRHSETLETFWLHCHFLIWLGKH